MTFNFKTQQYEEGKLEFAGDSFRLNQWSANATKRNEDGSIVTIISGGSCSTVVVEISYSPEKNLFLAQKMPQSMGVPRQFHQMVYF